MMKKYLLPLLLFAFFLTPVSAGSCNFGTMQPVIGFTAVPGATLEARINIYNPYGDSILHTKVNSVIVPDGWTYEFEPALSYVTYAIPGGTTDIEENVAVDPMPPTNDTSKYTNVEYLPSPAQIGFFIPSKVLTLRLDVPSNTILWKTFDFSFSVTGWCVDDAPGTVSVQQERDFKFQVKTVALEYYETRVVSIWETIGQYAIYIAVVLAIVITLVVLFVLRKMGKLIIKVEVK